ncbi:hypothetical protein BgAZ_303060 [Babesia gibsoni]|uniref:Uncharacterized protein n=1 Tax=Babesia gibsoni TaxID=33632 RepID=A0AAD8PD19_BABGI|nr:hypothetical protein BgAZ_303060 [Babesia gibsoni]
MKLLVDLTKHRRVRTRRFNGVVSRNTETTKSNDDMSILDLIPQLEKNCQVRDTLFEEVYRALPDDSNLSDKLEALIVLNRSIAAGYDLSRSRDYGGKVLRLPDIEYFVQPEYIQENITQPLNAGVFASHSSIRCECVKLLFATIKYFDFEEYGCLFNIPTLWTLLYLIEYGTSNRAALGGVDETWKTSVSIFSRLLCKIQLPVDIMRRLVDAICNKYDPAAVDFCQSFFVNVIFFEAPEQKEISIYDSLSGSYLNMSRRVARYLCSLAANSRDDAVLSKVCNALIHAGSHHFGVELLMHENCIADLMRISLTVVDRYNLITTMIRGRDIYNPENPIRITDYISQNMHKLSFDALSAISKMAFMGCNHHIKNMLDMGMAAVIVKILECPVSSTLMLTRAANTLGNLACETSAAVPIILGVKAIPALVNIFVETTEPNAKIECAYAICACLSECDAMQVRYIVACTARGRVMQGSTCISMLCDMLDLTSVSDPTHEGNLRLCKVILKALKNIMTKGQEEKHNLKLPDNPYLQLFMEKAGDVRLSKLHTFPDLKVASMAVNISMTFLNGHKLWSAL